MFSSHCHCVREDNWQGRSVCVCVYVWGVVGVRKVGSGVPFWRTNVVKQREQQLKVMLCVIMNSSFLIWPILLFKMKILKFTPHQQCCDAVFLVPFLGKSLILKSIPA